MLFYCRVRGGYINIISSLQRQSYKQQMNAYINTKIKRNQNTVQPHYSQAHPSKTKHRIILNQSANRRYQNQASKNLTRKSIDVTLVSSNNKPVHTFYNANTSQISKPYYRRPAGNPKKQTLPQHRYYQEEQRQSIQRASSKSPYVRMSNVTKQERQSHTKVQSLNKSVNKIRSGQLLKQNSPRYLFYRQPRSSLSQHYDPSIEGSLHKRRISAVDDKNGPIEEAKEQYKNSNYGKAIEILRKYIKVHRSAIQAHYLLGMSLINNSDFTSGIQSLTQTIELDPNYKRSLYLVIALAYKRLQKNDQAIDILTKGLNLYPDYYDCLVYRGKLQLKKDSYYHALKDFTKAIEINQEKGLAYLGKGMCQKELEHYEEAIQTLTQGSFTDMGHVCIEKRGIVYYYQGKYEQALKDLQQCTQIEGNQTSTAHYYKGLIFYYSQPPKVIDALLSFEESLKCDNNKEHVTASVEMMMRIKIQEKDFYEAYHILTRADNVEVQEGVMKQWRMFLEASLFLMKKKYKEGISTFQALLNMNTFKGKFSNLKTKGQKQRYKFIKPLIYLYKGYGQLCENASEKAAIDYQCYESLCSEFNLSSQDNLSKSYNKHIMKIFNTFPDCYQTISQAIELISTKPQPYLYLAFCIIQTKFQSQTDPILKNQFLEEAIQNLSIGIAHLPQLSNNHISTFYYFRSVLHLFRNDFNKAVSDVDKAIEKSQDNIPKYFYLRGLIFAIFGNFSQAVQDLTVAINLDQKYAKPYLQRAKCLQIQGNSNEAFLDLQRYITLAPQDQQIHKYAGYLLFQNCAYEDCLSAFGHGSQLENDYQLLLTKGKCHFLLGEEEKALDLFKKYAEMTYQMDYESDVKIMEICRTVRKDTANEEYGKLLAQLDKLISQKTDEDCKIFKVRDMHQLKASIYLILGQYQPSLRQFGSTLQLFNVQKLKQRQKHFIQDSEQFQDQWSEAQIKFNMSICLLCLKQYKEAREMLGQFEKSSQKGRNWSSYMEVVEELCRGKNVGKKELDTFEQNHRISKEWPKITIPDTELSLSMAFSYPFVEPPELLPQFDSDFFSQFLVSKTQQKPQAPWINRSQGGLIFTPNIQIYQNLQLSMTSTKKHQDSQKNKPVSQMDKSMDMSSSELQLQTQELKRKFKLDSMVQMRLKKLMKKDGQ